jgi:hypothetical protein
MIETSGGTVIQVYGKAFAGIIDLNMEECYKVQRDFALEPFYITDVSPFSIVDTPDPDMQKYTAFERTNARVKADVRKNFSAICEKSHCDWLVLDNTPALLFLIEIDGQYYSVVEEDTDFADAYFSNMATNIVNPAEHGFTDTFKKRYDQFIDIILRFYDPEKIILIKSSVPRFYSAGGDILETKHPACAGAFLEELDIYFETRVGCKVLNTPAYFLETALNQGNKLFATLQCDLKYAIEQDVVSAIEGIPSVYSGDNGKIKHTLDDVVGMLRQPSPDILSEKLSAPYLYTKSLWARNMRILRSYEYCFISLDDICWEEKLIIRLDAKNYIEISHDSIHKFNIVPDVEWDFTRFVANSYTCGLEDIEEALSSWEAYFVRGRENCKKPFVLRFSTLDDFIQSLYFIDYQDILSNENYCITMTDIATNIEGYLPKVDLSFFFCPDTVIWGVSGGLADQIRCIRLCDEFCNRTGLVAYFHDLGYDDDFLFVGMEAGKVTNKELEDKRLTRLISKKLRHRRASIQDPKSPPLQRISLSPLGLTDAQEYYSYRKTHAPGNADYIRKADMVSRTVVYGLGDMVEYATQERNKNASLIVLLRDNIKPQHKLSYEELFSFEKNLPLDNANRKALLKCKESDAIAIHIRRGDHITVYFTEEKSKVDYKMALKLVYKSKMFRKYTNKHLFVFSDEMDWVMENRRLLGFDLAGEEITYVNWNHHFNSAHDMALISECKIIIKGIGNFAHTAGMVSRVTDFIIETSHSGVSISWHRLGLDIATRGFIMLYRARRLLRKISSFFVRIKDRIRR